MTRAKLAAVHERSDGGMGASSRDEARHLLAANVRRQGYLPTSGKPVRSTGDGASTPLPAYIPYIGEHYFEHCPRLLCYCINQNLSRHAAWTDEWVARWARDPELAYDRLNGAFYSGRPLPIKPYEEGFVPLVAAIVLSQTGASFTDSGFLVDDVIGATNFVKFSTEDSASSSQIPLDWWRECGRRFVAQEVSVLNPDFVLAFGQKTFSELHRALKLAPNVSQPAILGFRFPARIPSDAARPLQPSEDETWRTKIAPLLEFLRPPKAASHHQRKHTRYRAYFTDCWQTCQEFLRQM